MRNGLNVLDRNVWPDCSPLRIRLWDDGVAWYNVNPAPGVFVWDELDAWVDAAEANGVRMIVYVLAGTPAWAARYPADETHPWMPAGSSSLPWDMKFWDEYVRQVATRYKGRITHYQVWNEPQDRLYYSFSSFNPLAGMAARAGGVLHQVDPNALVVAPPVMFRSFGLNRAYKILQAFADAGWPCDIYSSHVYPEVGYPVARWGELVNAWKAYLAQLGAPRKPLWVTECNFNLMHGALPEGQQCSIFDSVQAQGKALGVSTTFWYATGHSDPQLLGIPFVNGSAVNTAYKAVEV